MECRKALSSAELEKIINEISDKEYDSDDSEYVPSDDEGEIDVIEGLPDQEVSSQENSSSDSKSSDENSVATNEDEINVFATTSSDQNRNFVSKNNQVWYENPIKVSHGRQKQKHILREKSGPTRYANREVDSISSAFLIYFRKPLPEIIIK